MNTDIRVSIGFWNHRKTVKLMRKLGPEGAIALQSLWMWAAINREDGDMTGLDSEDIEISAGWNGEPGAFVSALKEFGWVDGEDGELTLHDWIEHNPWAFGAKERADFGRMGRLKQLNPKVAQELIAQGIEGLSKVDYETAKQLKPGSMWQPTGVVLGHPGAPPGTPQKNIGVTPAQRAPVPVPIPEQITTTPLTPLEGGGEVSGISQEVQPSQESEPESSGKDERPGTPPCPHEQIVAAYHELLPECPRVREWGAPNRKQLAARWREKKERQNLEWWRHVFRRVSESDFLMGRTSRDGPFVFSLGWFVKASNFAKVLNGQYENRTRKSPGKKVAGLTF